MYLRLGIEHIADFKGYDHILFLISIVASYQFTDWKKLLKLITAFTLGHSISLALSVLNIVHFSVPLIEFLIPITIVITSISNLFGKEQWGKQYYRIEYLISTIFGLIHGLGFSVLLRSLLGQESSIINPLFAFNLGLEMGQIAIVISILFLTLVLVKFIKYPQKSWTILLSGISLGVGLLMISQRWLW